MLFKITLLIAFVTLVTAQYGYDDREYRDEPHEAKPYNFGYSVKDIHGEQSRHETRDASGKVTGMYSFVDERGIERIVQYVADHLGFRAKVITNEPGTSNQHPANVIMESSQA